ncbi:hypothetical protein [Clostridium oryzae]|uniref:PHP domain protein n=1 Tax=Clostridium oryzae TaxID=1450648 RepID=A0A1V4ISS7_9CLOT|nr:hypothetical protein [Clostridium oryzae]OPJ63078.1 hypothetical protein CLORY_14440 [Clostridium oryzae]
MLNPYSNEGIWLKGNLHTHTENSPCGHYPIKTVIDMYTSYKMDYDFLAITDHFFLTNLSDYINNEKIILFQGVEFKTSGYQTLGINVNKYDDDKDNLDNHNDLFLDVKNQGGLNIICHPHFSKDDYWPVDKLLELDNYIGIEIYNNNVKFDNKGRAVATDVWDKLLSSGRKVLGFSNDDMHVFSRCGGAYNMVLAKERSRSAILDSIVSGSFYCTTGVLLDYISVEGSKICIKLQRKNLPVEFSFIGNNGEIIYRCFGSHAEFDCSSCTSSYIRVEMKREDGAIAWTQPFWL